MRVITWSVSRTAAVLLLVAWLPLGAEAFTSEQVARAVDAFFPDEPRMVAVARCESGLRQYTGNGTPLRGGAGGEMIGLFQLHERYHRSAARLLGYDIDTLLGNLAYARVLYRAQGIAPWAACVPVDAGGTVAITVDDVVVSHTQLSKTLHYGMRDQEVRLLQEVLNAAGYAATGPGSEHEYFDIATFQAVARFQCDQGIACLNDPSMRDGVGRVGLQTRTSLNQLRTTS